MFGYWRDECPPSWKARDQGDEAGHRGWGSNPYTRLTSERQDRPYCQDAERAWREGEFRGEDRRREEEYQQELEERHRREAEEYAHQVWLEEQAELEEEYEAEQESEEESEIQ